MAEGLNTLDKLSSAGFTPVEVDKWKADESRRLFDAGFSQKEINEHFGEKTPSMDAVKTRIDANFQKRKADFEAKKEAFAAEKDVKVRTGTKELSEETRNIPGPVPVTGKPEEKEPKVAETIVEAVEAGWDMSVSGLLTEKPDVILPEQAPMFYRIASQVSTLAGDIPAMIAGGVAGAAAGAAAGTVALPVVGTVGLGAVGTAAGAFAAPAGMREALMQHYEKGDIKSFGDFWERSSAVMIETLKGGTIGAATAGVGGAVGKVVAKPVLKTASVVASEVATMVTVGSALEGEMPEPEDFVDAAILVGGLRTVVPVARKINRSKITQKIRNIYSKTGVKPEQVSEQATADPIVRQELMSKNIEVPEAYRPLAEGIIEVPLPKQVVNTPGHTLKPQPKAEPVALPEAQAKILGQIGEVKDAPKNKISFDKLYTDFVDAKNPIKLAAKELAPEGLKVTKDPYALARLSVDHKSKVRFMVENGPLDFKTLNTKGKSLKSILEPFKEDVNGLEAYLISKRAIELGKRNIESGVDVNAAKAVVRHGKAKYEAAAKEMVEFQNSTLEYLRDSGVVSAEAFNSMKDANRSYIPFKRIVETQEGAHQKVGGKRPKTIKGSEAKIQRPLLSILENAESYVRLAEINRSRSALVDLANKTKGQELITKVKTKLKPVKISEKELAKELKAQGINPEAVEAMTVFRQQTKSTLAENQFEVFENGKRSIYETTPELAKAVKDLDTNAPAKNLLFKLAHGMTTVKKIGITFTPDFIARNLFRDQLTASVFSKGGKIPVTQLFSAMGDIVGKKKPYQDWLRSGGGGASFIELNTKYLEKDLLGLSRQTGLKSATWNVMQKPVELMHIAGTLAEQGTRLAEFKAVSKGKTDIGSLFEGGYASREVTLDFQRVGAKTAAFNAITAFQNVAIQGLDKTVRAVKENPKEVTAKSLAYITAPSVLLWYANKDDSRYKEVPRWEKDLFWIIPTDEWVPAGEVEMSEAFSEDMKRMGPGGLEVNVGEVYRVPKPQELGMLFGSLPERLLESFFTDNPEALKDFESAIGNLLTPALVPDIAAPVIEQYFNKSLFTGRPIIPHHLEGILPPYQYQTYTSETAKVLSKMIAPLPGINKLGPKNVSLASPLVVENYIRSWTGSLGMYAIQAADKGLTAAGLVPDPVKPDDTLADIPFVKAFVVRYPSAGAQSIQDFHEEYNDTKKVMDTVKLLAREGEFESSLEVLTMEENQDKLISLNGIKDALSKQSRMVRMIHKNPDISSEEKRQLIDGLYLTMIQVARSGNTSMRELKKEIKSLDKGK